LVYNILSMLYLIGLGLSTIEDISVSGLDVIKKCDHIFIDAYTSVLTHGIERISEFCGKQVKDADREFTENESNSMITLAKTANVAFLVVGDPLCATTHSDLIIRAIKEKIPYKVIHNAGIMTAVGCCGLQLYRMGETVSIPLWNEYFHPESFYLKIAANFVRGLHTLCLLDIKMKEKSVEALLHDRDIYDPPRFMVCPEAGYQILETARRIRHRVVEYDESDPEEFRELEPEVYLDPDCLVVCLARVGTPTQSIVVTTLQILGSSSPSEIGDSPEFSEALGGPMHCMIFPGELHPMEKEFLTSRLLVGDELEGLQTNCDGTSLPILLPPSKEGTSFKERVAAMFNRHEDIVKLTKKCR
uniref:diphthine methyl ester synthase n=1 Tax=Rodentolepis nana TaxID=102285 RepID=A0A158QHD9_RODNA